jgi:NADH:ubiquinone oxidoreductase subunit F (NADH-binding)
MNTSNASIFEVYSEGRSSLISLLQAIQVQEGFLSPVAIHRIAEHLGLTDNQVYSFASFYPWLRFTSAPDTGPKTTFLLAGLCPDRQEISTPLVKASPTRNEAERTFSSDSGPVRVATRNIGFLNPEEIEAYIQRDGYSGLEKALAGRPEKVAAAAKRSGLDEAECFGLSCDQQWNRCRQSTEKESYLIGHAASVDPISLTEFTLLENDPYGVLEGMLIAGYAAGASRGILYVDSRRPAALLRLKKALNQMQAAGYIGSGIQGSVFNFHIDVLPAPGPLPCGEVYRLIPALEGRRPDGCPDFQDSSMPLLHGRPVAIHSMETLAKLPAILNQGADWYAGQGTGDHKGTKVVTLAGCIRQPGLVEVPLGISLREIIDDIGGGVPEGEVFKAVQVGGPTGGWFSAEDLDTPLNCETLAAAGTRLGSGSLVVASGNVCTVELTRRALLFASMHSCGHCNFCREGTRQMSEILNDIIKGNSKPEDLKLLEDLSEGLQLGSSCSLGRTAPDAFLTTVRRFRKEYDAHMKNNHCPSGFCQMTKPGTAVLDTKRQD